MKVLIVISEDLLKFRSNTWLHCLGLCMTLFFFYQYNDTQLSCVFEKKKLGCTENGGNCMLSLVIFHSIDKLKIGITMPSHVQLVQT